MGLPHPQIEGKTICVCEEEVDRLGHHHLSCLNGGGVVRAHNAVRNALASVFRRAGYVVQMEVTGELLDGPRLREGQTTDLVLTKAGRKVLVDVTIRNPTAPSYVCGASRSNLSAARKGEQEKTRMYIHTPPGVRFLPASFEPFGAWGTQVAGFITAALSAAWADVHGHPNAPHLHGRLYQQISAAITRGFARSLLNKFGGARSQQTIREERGVTAEPFNGAFLSAIRRT